MPTIFASTPKWPSASSSALPIASRSRVSGPWSLALPALEQLRRRRLVVDLLRLGDRRALLAHRGAGRSRSSGSPRGSRLAAASALVGQLGEPHRAGVGEDPAVHRPPRGTRLVAEEVLVGALPPSGASRSVSNDSVSPPRVIAISVPSGSSGGQAVGSFGRGARAATAPWWRRRSPTRARPMYAPSGRPRAGRRRSSRRWRAAARRRRRGRR